MRSGNWAARRRQIAVYDGLSLSFGAATEPAFSEQVARALVNKGATLGAIGRSKRGAIAVYDEVDARFGAASQPALREQVAKALVNKGVALEQLGRSEDAIAVYDEVVVKFDAASRSRRCTSKSPGRSPIKGAVLGQLGRSEDAIAVFDEVLAKFGAVNELALREPIGRALVHEGRRIQTIASEARTRSRSFNKLSPGSKSSDGPERRLVARKRSAISGLAWTHVLAAQIDEALSIRSKLSALDPTGLALLDSAIELLRDNFGLAVDHLGRAFETGLEEEKSLFFNDLLNLLRVAEMRGYGERLIGWFESSGSADRTRRSTPLSSRSSVGNGFYVTSIRKCARPREPSTTGSPPCAKTPRLPKRPRRGSG